MATLKSIGLQYIRRADTEHQQAILRLGIMLLMLIYLVAAEQMQLLTQEQWKGCIWVAVFALPAGFALFLQTALVPRSHAARKVFGMFVDYACLGGVMLTGGAVAAPFSMLLMWTTIGHGLRFGARYLWVASGMAMTVLISLLIFSDYWAQERMLGVGVMLAVLAIPFYLSSLLNALTRAREVALQASAAKTRFLANMSHEFRTPLNGIIGSAELLSGARLSAEQSEYLNVIQSSSQALLAQVNDVLDLAAIEAGKIVRRDEDFSLSKLVNGVSAMLQPAASAKGLALGVNIDAAIPDNLHGDAVHLRQILINLVQNAVKFTPAGSVTISASRVKLQEGVIHTRFEIRDTGPGIPADARQRIFEAFEQGDQGIAKKYGGTGLGMTIVRMLTLQLKGAVSIGENPGGGACITVDLPFAEAQASQQLPEKVISFSDPFVRHRTRVPPLRILIADDQPANRMVLQRLLEKAGHRCEQVADGAAMLDRIVVERYDVVLLDLHMPDMSGIEAMKEARVLESGSERTPFIAVSADVTIETIAAARAEGIMDFLSKPVAVGPLLDAIANVAGPKRGGSEKAPPVRVRQPDASAIIETRLLAELLDVGLGDEFVGRFVEDSLRDIDSTLKRVNSAANQADRRALWEEVHAMKGIATNIGALRLAAACSDQGHLIPGSNPKLWREYAAKLERLVAEVREGLPQVLRDLRERQPHSSADVSSGARESAQFGYEPGFKK